MIRKAIVTLKALVRIKKYNKKHRTHIESRHANLEAEYGMGVLIGKGTYIGKETIIGDYSYVNTNSSIEKCEIGKYCSISSGVYINPYEHDYRRVTTHPIIRCKQNECVRKKVIIGNDVLISLNAIITEGVSIGNGAVIGAGAVVTKDVKPYEIVGGVPARHIKWRFEENIIDYLLQLEWWNWSHEKVVRELTLIDKEINE